MTETLLDRRLPAAEVRRLMATALGKPDASETSRFNARIKQIQRFDWPASMRQDSGVRRGYTLAQCLNLLFAMLLQEASIPITAAIRMARENHGLLLELVAVHVEAQPSHRDFENGYRSDSSVYVVAMGQEPGSGDGDGGHADDVRRLRTVRHTDLANLWRGNTEFPAHGNRLVIDLPGALASFFSHLVEHGFFSEYDLRRFAFFARGQADATAPFERFFDRVADRYRY